MSDLLMSDLRAMNFELRAVNIQQLTVDR
jgi:hypothetical protein